MRIFNNISAMNVHRNQKNNNKKMANNLEKLSSGLAVNRAADDAAGLAISSSMKAEIRALTRAEKNANDGMSLLKTMDGALSEISDILIRMIELSRQSENGIMGQTDLANLNAEFSSLKNEISDIVSNTKFNGMPILTGSTRPANDVFLQNAAGVTITKGEEPYGAYRAYIIEDIEKAVSNLEVGSIITIKGYGQENYYTNVFEEYKFEVVDSPSMYSMTDIDSNNVFDSFMHKILCGFSNSNYTESYIDTNSETWYAHYNFDWHYTTAEPNHKTEKSVISFSCGCIDDINNKWVYNTDNFSKITITHKDGSTETINPKFTDNGKNPVPWKIDFSGADKDKLIGYAMMIGDRLIEFTDGSGALIGGTEIDISNAANGQDIAALVNAALNNNSLSLSGATLNLDYDPSSFPFSVAGLIESGVTAINVLNPHQITFGVGYGLGETITLNLRNMSTYSLGIDALKIDTWTVPDLLVSTLKNALDTVSSYRAEIGAIQNRFEHTINNLNVRIENLTASESRIRDTDMAEKMSEYNKYSILNQAGIAMMAQANSAPQNILSLLQ